MSPFIVGKWNADTHEFWIDLENVKVLESRKSTEMDHCKNCPVKLHCAGCCLGETVNEFGQLDSQNIVKCRAICKLYEKLGVCEPYNTCILVVVKLFCNACGLKILVLRMWHFMPPLSLPDMAFYIH